MSTRTAINSVLTSLYSYTLLIGFSSLWCVGCAITLPTPKIYHSSLADPFLINRLCPVVGPTTAFSLHEDTHMSGAISCEKSGPTIVILNNVGMRVRTITVTTTGETRDEVSYLSANHTVVEDLMALLATARESSDHMATSGDTTVRLSSAKP